MPKGRTREFERGADRIAPRRVDGGATYQARSVSQAILAGLRAAQLTRALHAHAARGANTEGTP